METAATPGVVGQVRPVAFSQRVGQPYVMHVPQPVLSAAFLPGPQVCNNSAGRFTFMAPLIAPAYVGSGVQAVRACSPSQAVYSPRSMIVAAGKPRPDSTPRMTWTRSLPSLRPFVAIHSEKPNESNQVSEKASHEVQLNPAPTLSTSWSEASSTPALAIEVQPSSPGSLSLPVDSEKRPKVLWEENPTSDVEDGGTTDNLSTSYRICSKADSPLTEDGSTLGPTSECDNLDGVSECVPNCLRTCGCSCEEEEPKFMQTQTTTCSAALSSNAQGTESDNESCSGALSQSGLKPTCSAARASSADGSVSAARASSADGSVTVLPRRSDCIAMEQRQFLRSADKERRWLRRTLSQDVRTIAEMERRERFGSQIEMARAETEHRTSALVREASLRRWHQDVQRLAEEMQFEKQERENAKCARARQLQELRMRQEEEADHQNKMREKHLRDAERFRLEEAAMDERHKKELQDLEDKYITLGVEAEKRRETLEKNRQKRNQANAEAKEARDVRFSRVLDHCAELERARAAKLMDKSMKEKTRDERLARDRSSKDEQVATCASARSDRRKSVQVEADRLVAKRTTLVSDQVRSKGFRVDELGSERQRLQQFRRNAQNEARRAIELVRGEVGKQAVASKYSLARIQQQVDGLLQTTVLPPELQAGILTSTQPVTKYSRTHSPRTLSSFQHAPRRSPRCSSPGRCTTSSLDATESPSSVAVSPVATTSSTWSWSPARRRFGGAKSDLTFTPPP